MVYIVYIVQKKYTHSINMSANIEDDEAPPDLVDVTAMPAEEPSSSIDEEPTSRVPITLVTGLIVWILILTVYF